MPDGAEIEAVTGISPIEIEAEVRSEPSPAQTVEPSPSSRSGLEPCTSISNDRSGSTIQQVSPAAGDGKAQSNCRGNNTHLLPLDLSRPERTSNQTLLYAASESEEKIIPLEDMRLQGNLPLGQESSELSAASLALHALPMGSNVRFPVQTQPSYQEVNLNTDWLVLFPQPLQDSSRGFQDGPRVLMRAGLGSPVMVVRSLVGQTGGISVMAVELCLFHTNFSLQVDAQGSVCVNLAANSASLSGALLFCPPTALRGPPVAGPAGPLLGELISQVLIVPRSSGDSCGVFAAVAKMGIAAVAAGTSVAFTSMPYGVVFFLAE